MSDEELVNFPGATSTIMDKTDGLFVGEYLNGIDSNDGVFIFVTTNRVETLDPAIGVPRTDKKVNGTMISTRPGRIDRAIELSLLDEECRTKIAKRILNNFPEIVEKIVKAGDGDTGAQFQERATQVALKKFWEDFEKDKNENRN